MNKTLLIVAVILGFTGRGQNINTVTPASNPLVCADIDVTVSGDFPATNFLITGETITVNGTNINIQLNVDAPGFGLTVITPFTYTATIPANTITSSGNNILNVSTFFPAFGTTSTNTQNIVIGACCPASAGFGTNNTNFCWNDTVFVTDSSAGATSVDWYVNNVFDHSGAGDFTLNGLTGSVTIKQVASDGSCSDSSEVVVQVNPEPAVSFTSIQSGSLFTFTASGSNSFDYSWDFGDGNTGTGALVSHTYTADGTYNVCLTSTDADMCSSDSCTSVVYSSIGLHESNQDFRIYPNPATDIIQIEGIATTDINWFNELGQKINLTEEESSHQYIHVYNVSALPAGIYCVQWSDRAQRIIIR